MLYKTSGALNTGGVTTTLALPTLQSPRNTLYPAKTLTLSITNPTGSTKTINAGSITFTDTVGGSVGTITYVLTSPSIAAGANQVFAIPLSSGLLTSPTLSVTFASAPSAGSLSVQCFFSTRPRKRGSSPPAPAGLAVSVLTTDTYAMWPITQVSGANGCLGPDGRYWVAHWYGSILAITPSGHVTSYALPSISTVPGGGFNILRLTTGAVQCVIGSDNNIWAISAQATIYKVTTAGVATRYILNGAIGDGSDFLARGVCVDSAGVLTVVGRNVAISAGQFWKVQNDGTSVKSVIASTNQLYSLCATPTQLAVSGTDGSGAPVLLRLNNDGTEAERISSPGRTLTGVCMASNGKIAACSNQGGNSKVVLYNATNLSSNSSSPTYPESAIARIVSGADGNLYSCGKSSGGFAEVVAISPADGSIQGTYTFTNSDICTGMIVGTSNEMICLVQLTNDFIRLAHGPGVTSVSPRSALVSGNTSVTITGISFTGTTAVTFGGVNAVAFTVANDTTINAVVANAADGYVDVAVTNSQGTGMAPNAFAFAVAAPDFSGLAAYYGYNPFAYDDTVNANVETAHAGPTQDTGPIGGTNSALLIAATKQYFSILNSTSLTFTTAFTALVWTYLNTNAVPRCYYMKGVYGSMEWGHDFSFAQIGPPSLGYFNIGDIAGNVYAVHPDKQLTGRWSLLAVRFNGGQSTNETRLNINIDGTPQNCGYSGTIPATNSTGSTGAITVGGFPSFDSAEIEYTDGKEFGPLFFNRYLSDTDLLHYYGNGSPPVFPLIPGSPAAPTNLAVVGTSLSAALTWDAPIVGSPITIYRGIAPGAWSPTPIATGQTGTGYTDSGLTPGVNYYWVLRAVDGSSRVSAISNEVTYTTPLKLLTGLVAGYNADSPNMLVDLTGNGFTLTNSNGVTQSSSGIINKAFSLASASSQSLTHVDAPALRFTSNCTLSLQFKSATTGDVGLIKKGSYASSTLEWGIDIESNFLYCYLPTSVSHNVYGRVAFTRVVGTWYNVIFLYDGTQTGNANRLKCIINGVQQTLSFTGTIPAAITNGTGVFEIGHMDIGTEYFNGLETEIYLWNLTLVPNQYNALYGGGTPPPFSSFN